MNDLIQKALTYVRGMWHRRWFGMAAAWLAAIIGVAVALRVPERYEASARVYVDTQSLLRPLLAGLSIQPNLEQQVALMSRTLISRPNVEKLVRMADLDLGVNTEAGRDRLIDSVSKGLQLTGRTGRASTNLYVISYRDTSPERAKKVVQSLVTIFIESSLGDKRQDTRSAMKFVDEQIKLYETNLQTAENRLKDFKLKYLGAAGTAGQDYYAKLAKLSDEIDNARLQLRAAEESRDAFKRELAGEAPVLQPEASSSPVRRKSAPETDARIAALRAELDTLLRKYTEAHPDVAGTKRIIAELEEQRRQEMQGKGGDGPGRVEAAAERNPVFQQLRFSLAEAEANVASLRAKLASYESQYAQLKGAAKLVPEREAELAQLNRDYEVQKKTFETLLTRRESAAIGEGVQDSAGTQFRVVDPPRVTPEPVPPTRIALLGIVAAIAVVAGLLASLLASQVMPTFHDARSLREITRRPILGMVTMLPSEALSRMRTRNTYLFAGCASVLFVAFAAVLALTLLTGRMA